MPTEYVATVSDLSALEVQRRDNQRLPGPGLSLSMPATVSLVSRPGVEIKAHMRQLPSTGMLGSDQDKACVSRWIPAAQKPAMPRVISSASQSSWSRSRMCSGCRPAAIRTFEGRKFVVIQENAGQRRVDVKLGIEGEDRVEIASGLTEGQIVVGQ